MILKLEREISDHHAPSFGIELLCALALMKFEAFEVNYTRVDKIFRTSLRSRHSFSKAREGNESASKCEKLRSKMSGFSWKTYPFRAHFLSLFLTPSHLMHRFCLTLRALVCSLALSIPRLENNEETSVTQSILHVLSAICQYLLRWDHFLAWSQLTHSLKFLSRKTPVPLLINSNFRTINYTFSNDKI